MITVYLCLAFIAGGAITDRWRHLRRPRKHTAHRGHPGRYAITR